VHAVDPAALLDDLDPDQRRAVSSPSSLVAVIAGAGSGKTRVLTRRVAYRIADGTADARHTLVLTFTREAAGELRRRLPRLGLGDRVEAGTFHSVMLGLLRQRWADRNTSAPTVTSDRRRLVGEAAGRASLDEIVAEIDWASARGIGPEAYVAASRAAGRRPSTGHIEVARAYGAYREVKRRKGVIDLDDVLANAIEALTHDLAFADAVRWRFRHVLVDEAQDLNPLQHQLVDLLRMGVDDLFIVGDPAQAVYGFNGADPSLLLEVERRFPGVEVVRLSTNHRCTPQIVDAGVHVLTVSGHAAPLRSARPDGPTVRVVTYDDETAEAAGVATSIRHLDPALVRSGQVAVLARTHAQLTILRAAFADAGIVVRERLDGAGSPYRDAIGAAARLGSASRLREWAHDVLDGTATGGPHGRTPSRGVRDVDAERQVADAVLDFLREQPTGDGMAFRNWIVTADPFGLRGVRGVDVLTFHAAKGREWHTTFVVGVETSLVPHRSATTGAARAEEARLLYVALTRATDHVTVSWAARRAGYQRRPSPLVAGYSPVEGVVAPPPADVTRLVQPDPSVRRSRELQTRLSEWRDHTARAAGILPDAVCSDSVLAAIAGDPPASAEELAAVSGMGAITSTRLFPGIRAALDAADDQVRRSTSTGA
jgi:DNA helicase-2/ATP-dependent DNA helicase PcrA